LKGATQLKGVFLSFNEIRGTITAYIGNNHGIWIFEIVLFAGEAVEMKI